MPRLTEKELAGILAAATLAYTSFENIVKTRTNVGRMHDEIQALRQDVSRLLALNDRWEDLVRWAVEEMTESCEEMTESD